MYRAAAEGRVEHLGGHDVAQLQRDIGNAATATVVQRAPKAAPSGVSARLARARKAIEHTKQVLSFGAGNQAEALRATNLNSYYRMKVMRDEDSWELTESAMDLARDHPTAYIAAKADIARGGNAGEHAAVAFDYLRATTRGEKLSICSTEKLDHAFVIIGDLGRVADLVVADPWPTRAEALPWAEHFAYTPDRDRILVHDTAVSDGKKIKEAIKAGLKLTARGQAMVKAFASVAETDRFIRNEPELVWDHPSTRR
jgi:hypothetical protein